MKKAKQILEELYTVYNPNDEQDIPSKFDSKELRNLMIGALLELDEDMTQALIKAMDKMPDSWIIEFIETINGYKIDA